jgi:hypothetical protein
MSDWGKRFDEIGIDHLIKSLRRLPGVKLEAVYRVSITRSEVS